MSNPFGELWNEAKQGAGDLVSGGAHLLGDGLNAVGAHGAAQDVEAEGDKAGYALGADVPELQLGQTSDPAQLVHGNPGEIRSTATKLRGFASGFGEVAAGLHGTDTAHWEGAAADAFRAKFSPQPAKWQAATEAMGKAATALESYAGAVESAQSQARQAIVLWDQAQGATAQATALHDQQVAAYDAAARDYDARLAAGQDAGARPSQPAPFSDPGAGLRAQAQQVLASARSRRDSAAASAAAAVSSATSLAPAEPSFLAQLEDNLSDTLKGGALGLASFSDGVVEGVAGLARFARSLNPVDPSNLEHPGEYAAGLSGTLAGLVNDAQDPAGLVKSMLGSGWGSDPAEALGKLAPTVAIAAVTAGGGAAAGTADVGTAVGEDAGASVAEDAGATASQNVTSRGLGDMTRVGDPVDVATGDVVFAQADVALPGALPLVFERVHRSSWRGGRWLGQTWASTFDQRLLVAGDTVAAVFADGRVLYWRREDLDGEDPVLPVAGPAWPLTRLPGGAYTVTDPRAGLTWRYEPRPGFWQWAGGQGQHPLVSVTDRNGHAITYGYQDDGSPASVTHSGGYRISVATSGGRVTGLTLDAGPGDGGDGGPGGSGSGSGEEGGTRLVSYEYDGAGNLAGVINSSGRPLRLSYDGAGRMTGWTDRAGHSYRYEYDDLGRCVRGESPGGQMSGTFSYQPGITRWADAAGAVTTYRLDASLRVSAITGPLGATTRFTRDGRGRVTSRTDPLGRVTRYAWDHAGNLVSVTRPDGTTARAVHDERGLPVAVTGADGATWRQDYDERGNRTAVTAPDGSVTRYGYDSRGYLASVTGPDGATTTISRDAAGLPVTVTAPGGAATRYQHDRLGRIRTVTRPDGAEITLTWTVEGRPATRTLPDGGTETWDWDPDGHLTRHVTPGGAVTAYEYGPFDTLSAVTGPDRTRIAYGYDHELRLTSVTHGGPGVSPGKHCGPTPDGVRGPGASPGEHEGLTWLYEYDPAGRLVAETDYNGATTRYLYDPAGQLTRRVNAAGQETTYAYDQAGRLTAKASGGAVTTLDYDPAGRLARTRNDAADIRLSRDALGRVTAETVNGRTTTWSYDPAGRITGRITPSGAATAWDWDPAGRPAAMTSAGRQLRFAHDSAGRETRRELPGGLALAQDWDPRGQLTSQVLTGPGRDAAAAPGRVLQRRAYAYNPDGYLTATADLLAGDRAFGLDPSGRVTAVTGPGWTEAYAYDPAGTITTASWPEPPGAPAPGTPAREPGTPHGRREHTGTLVTQAGNVRYRHDAAGRVIQRTRTRLSRKPETWHYQWDADNRLTAVTTPDGTTWHYHYDPMGRRITKRHTDTAGHVLAAITYAWDGNALAEQAEHGPGPGRSRVTTWDYRPGTFTPLTQATRTTLRDAPQQVIDEQFHAIITDLTGTPSELVAPDGTLAGHQQRTLWGTTTWGADGASTPLRFPGQYHDPETGLHYNNQRYYDPHAGAYLTPDPLGLAASPNPHAYVPNPCAHIDPLGLEPGAAARQTEIEGLRAKLENLNAIKNRLVGGRSDGEAVLSGHGGIGPGDNTLTTVPDGTSVAMYSKHGESLSISHGNWIETGVNPISLEEVLPDPKKVYGPGDQLPNYILQPPSDLKVLGQPVTVTSPTRLSELLKPGMGRVHWAACRSIVPGIRGGLRHV